MATVTCIAPVNIAVIKYWGKRNEELILPLNDSVSSTLSLEHVSNSILHTEVESVSLPRRNLMTKARSAAVSNKPRYYETLTTKMCAKTTITASPNFKENKFWLNGKEETFDNPRLANCLKDLKNQAQGKSEVTKWNIHICSENNFPTAAGLASSAAGYACLVYALGNLYGVQGDISAFARRGSGSACRSVFGGWVQWHAGSLKDGSDSIATQVVPASHWPEMRILILVVNDSRKKYSSTSGMKQSVATSPFLKYRAEKVVPERTVRMIKAIKERDFETFAALTMQDSNQFHSVCLDTFPPCTYMNDVSHSIVELVHAYNDFRGSNKVAYTFDAGPNACLYMLEKDVPEVAALVQEHFPAGRGNVEYIKGLPVGRHVLSEQLTKSVKLQKHEAGSLKYLILTKVGDGPKVLKDAGDHLLNEAGLPQNLL